MVYIDAIVTVITPLVLFIIPGILYVHFINIKETIMNGARVLLWSLGVNIIITFGAAVAGVPAMYAFIFIVLVSLYVAHRSHVIDASITYVWYLLAFFVPLIFIYGILAVPFVLIHDALPTGDVQKSIFWAQDVIDTNTLPQYSTSQERLNRDPADFYTPGLHTITALLMTLSPFDLISTGLFSVVGSAAVALIAAAIAWQLFSRKSQIFIPLATAFLILTNIRFLRYIREPGYHYQNLFGEVLLFGLVLVIVSLIRSWRWDDALLGGIIAGALIVSHQFSVFVGLFALIPIGCVLIATRIEKIMLFVRSYKAMSFVIIIVGLIIVGAGFPTGIYDKIPHLFTLRTHLLAQVPPIQDYPYVTGTVWFFAGLSGLLYSIVTARHTRDLAVIGFALSTIVFLALSFGPRLLIDIPPVRALYYSVVPLSVFGALMIYMVASWLYRIQPRMIRVFVMMIVFIALGVPILAAAYTTFTYQSHYVRTNSSFLPEFEESLRYLRSEAKETKNAIMIDDYNRRSASWFLLGGHPMVARIAADLERQMDESIQSDVRRNIYLNQLDYEKIFALGSRDDILPLLSKHSIRWVTGIEESSDTSLRYNAALREVVRSSDVIVYEREEDEKITEFNTWLIRPTTLANDIGDREDTFEHLQASIRAPRLSQPLEFSSVTYRSTTASVVPLRFNVGDYVKVLWDQDRDSAPDGAVELLIECLTASSISIVGSSGSQYSTVCGQKVLLPSEEAIIDDKGFVTITLLNPHEQLLEIDLIALGLSQIP